jgi:hypothetical protein
MFSNDNNGFKALLKLIIQSSRKRDECDFLYKTKEPK